MNSAYNKIDDIFKKALEGAAEQPPAGLWRKISGRLLWKEIIRFNFTNLPYAYTGMAAAVIVSATLLVFNFLPSAPENSSMLKSIEKNAVTKQQDEQIQSLKENTFSSAPGDSKNQVTPSDNIENQDNNPNKTTEVLISDSEKESNNRSAEDFTPITASKSIAEPVSKHNQLKTPGAVVAESKSAILPKKDAGSHAAIINKTDAGTLLPAGENNFLTPQQRQTTELTQLESRKLSTGAIIHASELIEIPNSEVDFFQTDNEALDKFDRGSGKIQKMHSMPFAIGQFLQGKYKPPRRDFEKMNADKYHGKNHILSLAAYFAPEMTNYTRMASTSREQNYIGGLALNYTSANYMLQGGFELSYSTDMGDYMINMQTYDSTGYYDAVGSFIIDPENPGSIIFNTVPVAVWDSVQHALHQQTQNQYTYLQFPLMIGYKAFQSGLFSAYIKAGPSFSFLLNRKEPQLIYYNPDATIQNIINHTPTRLNTSVQILLSLCLQYQASEKIGILLEPTYRYYLKSVYDVQGSSLKNPYGIGVRGGIFYNF